MDPDRDRIAADLQRLTKGLPGKFTPIKKNTLPLPPAHLLPAHDFHERAQASMSPPLPAHTPSPPLTETEREGYEKAVRDARQSAHVNRMRATDLQVNGRAHFCCMLFYIFTKY